jgi:transposase
LYIGYFPSAILCADSFHVIKLINDTFNAILKSLLKQHQKGTDEYYLLKKKRYLLLANQSSIDWFKFEWDYHFKYHIHSFNLKDRLFYIDPIIKDIYNLKEDYITFNRLRDPSVLSERLDLIISQFIAYPHKEIKRVGRTLLKWKNEILNSFIWFDGKRISNGSIESRNTTIKLLIRNAAGFRNYQHLRIRSIYVINSTKKER